MMRKHGHGTSFLLIGPKVTTPQDVEWLQSEKAGSHRLRRNVAVSAEDFENVRATRTMLILCPSTRTVRPRLRQGAAFEHRCRHQLPDAVS
jgi:hypothetical protein